MQGVLASRTQCDPNGIKMQCEYGAIGACMYKAAQSRISVLKQRARDRTEASPFDVLDPQIPAKSHCKHWTLHTAMINLKLVQNLADCVFRWSSSHQIHVRITALTACK